MDAIGERGEVPTRPAREGEHGETDRGSAFGRRDDVRGVAARRDAEEDVPGPSQRLHLPREDAVDAEVVADRREQGRVRGQCDRTHRWTWMVEGQGADELRREVLCVR